MKKIYIALLALLFCQLTWGQEAYVCMPSARTGFKFNLVNGNWEQVRFTVENKKRMLKLTNGEWMWQHFGEDHIPGSCSDGGSAGKSEFNSAGFIFCEVFGGSVRMSKNSLRYIETYLLGYVDGRDKNPDTPLIEIGVCLPL